MDKERLSKRANELANYLLVSDKKYLETVIELWQIGCDFYLEAWGTEFHIFGVISSETDHLPIASVRQHCSVSMLEKSDKELAETIAFYKPEVTTACNEILSKHSVESV